VKRIRHWLMGGPIWVGALFLIIDADREMKASNK
jgi:hypothetical protein